MMIKPSTPATPMNNPSIPEIIESIPLICVRNDEMVLIAFTPSMSSSSTPVRSTCVYRVSGSYFSPSPSNACLVMANCCDCGSRLTAAILLSYQSSLPRICQRSFCSMSRFLLTTSFSVANNAPGAIISL